MGQALLRWVHHADQSAQQEFLRLRAEMGARRASGAMAFRAALLGGVFLWNVYALIAVVVYLWPRRQDDILVLLFLMLLVLIGTLQGVWLGAITGSSWAFRVQGLFPKAGAICWIGCLPYLALIGWLCYCRVPVEDWRALLWLCGVPLLWAAALLAAAVHLLCKPC